MSDASNTLSSKSAQGLTITAAEETLVGPSASLFSLLRERRGWTDEYLAQIENRNHPELVDMDRMVHALNVIKTSGIKIVVMPDFDMDGITSGTLGYAGLAELGFNVELYTPDFRNGHDITVKAVDDLHTKHPGVGAVITCDAGINSTAGIARMKQLGLIALVTDHHVELNTENRVADVAIDPGRIDDTYETRGELSTTICGAHVLWQVLDTYARLHAPHKIAHMKLLRLFAGIGTVTDVMPLTFENRQMVRDSVSLTRLLWVGIEEGDVLTEYDPEESTLLQLIRMIAESPVFASVFEGYAYVLKAFREAGKLRNLDDISSEFYGFYLGPAFNAIRRVDGEMEHAFGAFTADTPELKLSSVETVLGYNELRKELTKEYLQTIVEADTDEQPYAPFVYLTDAPSGMLGLLAQQLMRLSSLPTVVIRRVDNDTVPTGGSARSPFWYPVIKTLTPEGFFAIGHENACGVQIDNMTHAQRLHDTLRDTADEIYTRLDESGELAEATRPDLILGPVEDADADGSDLDALLDMAEHLDRLAPFGQGFERPVFELALDLSKCHIQTLGSEETHVRIVTPNGLKVLWWNQAERIPDLEEIADNYLPGKSIARFRVDFSINDFMGNISVQAQVTEFIEPDNSY